MVCHDLQIPALVLYTCSHLCVVASGLVTQEASIVGQIIVFLKTDLNLMTCLCFKQSNSVKIFYGPKWKLCAMFYWFDYWYPFRIHGFRIQDSGIQEEGCDMSTKLIGHQNWIVTKTEMSSRLRCHQNWNNT